MQCPDCGAENADSATFCTLCMRTLEPTAAPPRPDGAGAPAASDASGDTVTAATAAEAPVAQPAAPAPVAQPAAPAPIAQPAAPAPVAQPAVPAPVAQPSAPAPAPAVIDEDSIDLDAAFLGAGAPVIPDEPIELEATFPSGGAPAAPVDDEPFADPYMAAAAASDDAAVVERNWARKVAQAGGDADAAKRIQAAEIESALVAKRKQARAKTVVVHSFVAFAGAAAFAGILFWAYGWMDSSTTAAPAVGPLIGQLAAIAVGLAVASSVLAFSAARVAAAKRWGLIAAAAALALEAASIGQWAVGLGSGDMLAKAQALGVIVTMSLTAVAGLIAASSGGRE